MTAAVRVLGLFAIMLASAPAAADLTAIYQDSTGRQTIVEVTDDGFARIGSPIRHEGAGPPDYSIFRPDGDYFIWHHEAKPKVARFDVYNEALWASMLFLSNDLPLEVGERPKPRLAGKTLVNGRPGTVYTVTVPDDGVSTIVISADRKLRPLSAAWQAFYRTRHDMHRDAPPYFDTELPGLLAASKKGAPIKVGDAELVSIDFAPIERARFDLPGAPLTKGQVLAIIGYATIGPFCPNESCRIRRERAEDDTSKH